MSCEILSPILIGIWDFAHGHRLVTMPSLIGKRKREQKADVPVHTKKAAVRLASPAGSSTKQITKKIAVTSAPAAQAQEPLKENDPSKSFASGPLHIQIVTGSYERVLHGIIAVIPRERISSTTTPRDGVSSSAWSGNPVNDVTFSDSFLFTAHSSAIRCLAISPSTGEADKRILATGSSDERINVYSLSTAPPTVSANATPKLPTLSGSTGTTTENPRNRSLGSLIHHDRAITCLEFPTKSKLFSGAEDATVAISRTRDWTMLSSIKAPIPKPQGRPSGDTAGPGEIPAGINAFAIHPSQKLMLSVGRGEKCMRLWNLMTGKKAGVLNFDRELLKQAGEGKFSSGEGRGLIWDDGAERFVVGFERGAAVFGTNCKPESIIMPLQRTKLHRMRIVPRFHDDWNRNVLAFSSEDGRVLFFDLDSLQNDGKDETLLPRVDCVGEMGGPSAGITGRVKDFDIIDLGPGLPLLFMTASSDGAVRLWAVDEGDLSNDKKQKQIGRLIATLETGDRITCIGSFVLDGKTTEEDDEFEGFREENGDKDNDSGDDD